MYDILCIKSFEDVIQTIYMQFYYSKFTVINHPIKEVSEQHNNNNILGTLAASARIPMQLQICLYLFLLTFQTT